VYVLSSEEIKLSKGKHLYVYKVLQNNTDKTTSRYSWYENKIKV